MTRLIADALALFLVPFAVYGLLLIVRQRYPWLTQSWSRGSLAVLTVAGLALVLVGLVAFGGIAQRHQGPYVPAHLDHGRLVPGAIQ